MLSIRQLFLVWTSGQKTHRTPGYKTSGYKRPRPVFNTAPGSVRHKKLFPVIVSVRPMSRYNPLRHISQETFLETVYSILSLNQQQEIFGCLFFFCWFICWFNFINQTINSTSFRHNRVLFRWPPSSTGILYG